MWHFLYSRSLRADETIISVTLDKQVLPLLEEQTRWSVLALSSPAVWKLVLTLSRVRSSCVSQSLLFFPLDLLTNHIAITLSTDPPRSTTLMPATEPWCVAAFKLEHFMLDNSSHWIASPFHSCPFSYLLPYLKFNLLTLLKNGLKFAVLDSDQAALCFVCCWCESSLYLVAASGEA